MTLKEMKTTEEQLQWKTQYICILRDTCSLAMAMGMKIMVLWPLFLTHA